MNVYFMYQNSLALETDQFHRRTADYVFMLLFLWGVMLLVAYMLDLFLIGVPIVIAILYVRCNLNPDMIVPFWFGTRFKAMYLPWVLMGFNILLGGNGLTELIGIFVGHVYFYLKYVYPTKPNGVDYLITPQWLKNQFPVPGGPQVRGFGGDYASNNARPAAAPAPRRWPGGGQRLGGD